MRITSFLVLINFIFFTQVNSENSIKSEVIRTYKLHNLESNECDKTTYAFLKFIQFLYQSDITDLQDIEGMQRLESNEFMVLPIIKEVDEISDKPGIYTIASMENIKISQRIFDVSERISGSYYVMYSIETTDKKMFVVFSGVQHYKRFHRLYFVKNKQEFLSKLNSTNLLKIFDDHVENYYGLQQMSQVSAHYFLIYDKQSNKNYIVSNRLFLDNSWHITTFNDNQIQKIKVVMHHNAKAFYQDKTLRNFISILDELLGKPNPINTGTAPYSNTNGLIRLRAQEIVKNSALRPWASLDYKQTGLKKFNTIDHIFKRLEDISTDNWLVRKQFASLKRAIPKARTALLQYYKQVFSYKNKLAKQYADKNLDVIICAYFNFDR